MDSLGDRMKGYEDVSRIRLTRRLPVIIRLDGRAFHTYTRDLERPYSQPMMKVMNEVTIALCKEISGVQMAYTQSDEISLLLVDYEKLETNPWFGGNLQKMVSVSAGIASSQMTLRSSQLLGPQIFGAGPVRPAVFDARAFVIPQADVNNYFVWRQKDWNRNSLAMLAQSLASHKELQGLDRAAQHELCFQRGTNWADLSSHIKDGRVIVQQEVLVGGVRVFVEGVNLTDFSVPVAVSRREWKVLETTPIFSAEPGFVNSRVFVGAA